MKKIISALLPLLLGMPLAAQASDWQHVAETKEQWYSMDFASLVTVKNYRKAWIREDSLKDQETTGYPKKNYRSGKFLYYFDCNGRRIGSIQKILYEKMFAGGDVVESTSIKFNDNILDEVAPDTIGEGFLEVACSNPTERAKLKAKNKAAEDAAIKEINPSK